MKFNLRNVRFQETNVVNDRRTFLFSCTADSAHINLGAISIFLAWIDLLLFIQKFPSLGIYVVMFTDVTKTFLKFSITFILFVMAFGFSFYFLIGDKVRVLI